MWVRTSNALVNIDTGNTIHIAEREKFFISLVLNVVGQDKMVILATGLKEGFGESDTDPCDELNVLFNSIVSDLVKQEQVIVFSKDVLKPTES